ncbi:MAG: hypothetical protein J6Y08_07280 [Clostridiales bacterium]|nr:hypothetical protein [Clostridiales bacterium]
MNPMEKVCYDKPRREERKSSNEYGFYIACDDRAILNCVNTMLLSAGMVGLSDTEGKMHYLIDGRRGGNYVLDRVKTKVLTICEVPPEKARYEDALVFCAIDDVLQGFGMDPGLTGTQILRYLLYRLYQDPKLLKGVSKSLYPLADPVFQMSPVQVERNIRYAVRKSSKIDPGMRVVPLLRTLLDAVLEKVVDEFGRA